MMYNKNAADRESFDRKVRPYLEPIRQTALWLAKNENDANRLIQDLFYAAFRLWQQRNHFPDIKMRMFKILVRLYFNSLYRAGQRAVPDVDSYINENPVSDDIPGRHFTELSEDIRLSMILSLIGEFSYTEIGDILGIKTERVRANLNYGYGVLRREIANFAAVGCH